MSDILASIRKIMAQEPAGPQPPSLTRMPLNGVSGAGLDLPLGPELKLPPTKSEPASPAGPATVEAVSLDELLADSPLAPPPSPAKGPTLVPVSPPAQAGAALDAKPTKDAPAPAMDSAALPSFGPKLGDLGSVVPGKREAAAASPSAPSPLMKDERSPLGPPIPGPLLGEPARVPPSAEPLPEVPGADALRRLIAGVIPPSAHPSIAPAKAPEKAPESAKLDAAPAPTAPVVAEKVIPAPKPEIKVEAKAPAPATVPAPADKPVEKKPEPPAPAPAAAIVAAPAPAPKPAPTSTVPTRAAKLEAVPNPPLPSSPAPGKTMDETVSELLRPLLREWLDKNMSRLIEPALKAELQALRTELTRDKKD